MSLPKSKKLHFLARLLLTLAAVLLIVGALAGVLSALVSVTAVQRPEQATNAARLTMIAIGSVISTVVCFWLLLAVNRRLNADADARTPLKHENNPFVCKCCGKEGPTANVRIIKQVGMLIARQQTTLEGRICKSCISENARNFSLVTLLLGWWGLISFFLTPFVLIGNFIAYLSGRKLSAEEIDAVPASTVEVGPDDLLKVKDLVTSAIKEGADIEELSKHIVKTIGIRPANAYRCICDLAAAA